jgi:hypothetical protein
LKLKEFFWELWVRRVATVILLLWRKRNGVRNRSARPFSFRIWYQELFCAALTFAHRARCAAAILLLPAADIVAFLRVLAAPCFWPVAARAFAQRAL